MQIQYELDINRMMHFIKRAIKSKKEWTLENCHYISDLFKDFIPKRILSKTNSELRIIEDKLANEILDSYPFLNVDAGYEPENGLFGSLGYNLFQLLTGSYIEGEGYRLKSFSGLPLSEYLKWINS